MCEYYKKHMPTCDLAVAVILSIAAIVTFDWMDDGGVRGTGFANWIGTDRSLFYRTFGTIDASLWGFTLTGLSISITFADHQIANSFKRTGHLAEIFSIFKRAMFWLGAGLAVALIGLVFDTNAHPSPYLPSVLLVVESIAAIRFVRCGWILIKIAEIKCKASPTSGSSTKN